MKPKTAVLLILSTSVFFACAIILADTLLEGTKWNQIVMYSLIALWWIPFVYLSVASKRSKQTAFNGTAE
ncbi:hypothetical protein Pan241w_41110 [Gimesia alba]|uniref:Uncharacterized protein n=1 Tax=Gimesia alba TaxID=2527973 RepID=A0A517RJE6_9PLAN|nr:hypothetical protein [Gimesia alba]QDT44007.1 hypothetical protein Pan241w_41110 [Gimesia alba]